MFRVTKFGPSISGDGLPTLVDDEHKAAAHFNSLRLYCGREHWLVITDDLTGRWLAESVYPDAFMLRQGPGDDDQRKMLKDPNGLSAVDLTVAQRLARDEKPYKSPFVRKPQV